jgi:hypothetical protein
MIGPVARVLESRETRRCTRNARADGPRVPHVARTSQNRFRQRPARAGSQPGGRSLSRTGRNGERCQPPPRGPVRGGQIRAAAVSRRPARAAPQRMPGPPIEAELPTVRGHPFRHRTEGYRQCATVATDGRGFHQCDAIVTDPCLETRPGSAQLGAAMHSLGGPNRTRIARSAARSRPLRKFVLSYCVPLVDALHAIHQSTLMPLLVEPRPHRAREWLLPCISQLTSRTRSPMRCWVAFRGISPRPEPPCRRRIGLALGTSHVRHQLCELARGRHRHGGRPGDGAADCSVYDPDQDAADRGASTGWVIPHGRTAA